MDTHRDDDVQDDHQQKRPVVKRLPPDAMQRALERREKKNALLQLRERHRIGDDEQPRSPSRVIGPFEVPDGRYIRPSKMPKKWTSLYDAVDFLCRMAFVSGGGNARLFPGEIVEQICRPSIEDGQELFNMQISRVVATLGGPILAPETAGEAIVQIRDAISKLEISEVNMPATIEAEVSELAHRVAKARDELARTARGEQRQSNNKMYWETATEVLAAVRRQAGLYIPKGYGEGIPKSVDVDHLRKAVLGFLDAVIESEDTPPNLDALEEAMDAFLTVLKAYDGTIRCGIDLVLTGSKLVVALVGSGSIWGLFAQLNVAVMGKPVMESNKFIEEMQRLCVSGERLRQQERQGGNDEAKIRTWLNDNSPLENRLPWPTRFCTYTRTNEATYLLHVLAGGQWIGKPEPLDDDVHLARVAELLKKLKSTDSNFELNPMTDFLYRAVLADQRGQEEQKKLVAWLRPPGRLSHKRRDFAADLVKRIRDREDSAKLVAVAMRYLFMAYPAFRDVAA